jgi:hypothetical protein
MSRRCTLLGRESKRYSVRNGAIFISAFLADLLADDDVPRSDIRSHADLLTRAGPTPPIRVGGPQIWVMRLLELTEQLA